MFKELELIFEYEHELLEYGRESLQRIPELSHLGNAERKTSILSFTLNGLSPDEVGNALNEEGITVRTGRHCSPAYLRNFGLESVIRASLHFITFMKNLIDLHQH